jgi:DNA-binding transcriptional ArsR family regulator
MSTIATVPSPIDSQFHAVEQLSTLLKASGDTLRLEILRVLDRESFGVHELCSIFAMRQPAMSHHLKVLARVELIASRREGNSIFYRRHHQSPAPQWQALWQNLLLSVDDLPLRQELRERIEAVHRDRSDSSRQFFEENASRFRAQQELIAIYQQYAEPLLELMDAAHLPSHSLALEIGPGEGAFLAELAPRFERLVALDISDTMLNLARARCEQLDNIEFILGDTATARRASLQPDCIVANMVLHHTPSPADVFADMAALLKPAGSIFLSELCRHDQAWAREACGDLWLGLDPEDISHWATAVGLEEGQHLYFAQRNGFSVQLRQFIKQAPINS